MQGNPDAQYNLGNCYYYGEGVEKSFVNAIEWYRKAAYQGLTRAIWSLEMCYCNEKITRQVVVPPAYFYVILANRGDEEAQCNVGNCYYYGEGGVPQSYEQAFYWYQQSAKKNCPRAQYGLGNCYFYGQGVDKDYTQAVEWFRKSSKKGDRRASYCLGICYELGKGVRKNLSHALTYYEKAANQGHHKAKKKLEELKKQVVS